MTCPIHDVPRLETRNGSVFVVRWGRVGDLVLRAGDHLRLGAESEGKLLLLEARGFGRPMLARRVGGRLVAEPGGVPVSTTRWQVSGSVVGIDRDLERGCSLSGAWSVAVRAQTTDGLPAVVPASLQGGQLTEGALSHLLVRAAGSPSRHGLLLAVSVAETEAAARSQLQTVPAGTVRYQLPVSFEVEPTVFSSTNVVVGPWANRGASSQTSPPVARMQLSLFGDSRMRHGA